MFQSWIGPGADKVPADQEPPKYTPTYTIRQFSTEPNANGAYHDCAAGPLPDDSFSVPIITYLTDAGLGLGSAIAALSRRFDPFVVSVEIEPKAAEVVHQLCEDFATRRKKLPEVDQRQFIVARGRSVELVDGNTGWFSRRVTRQAAPPEGSA